MKQISKYGCNNEKYTQVVCTHDEILEKILPANICPLSCRELATEIVDWVKFYKLKENTAFTQGYDTSDIVVITPKGDYLFAHDFAKKALPYKENSKRFYYPQEEVPFLPQDKGQAWKVYNSIKNLAGVLEIKRKDLRRLIKPEKISRKVNLLADTSISQLDGIKKEIMQFLFGSEDLFYEYIDKINELNTQTLSRLENRLIPSPITFPPIFFDKARYEMPSFEIIRLNGNLPQGIYLFAGERIYGQGYSFLYKDKSPFKEKKEKSYKIKKGIKSKNKTEWISLEEVGEKEFERLKQLMESKQKKKKNLVKPMKGEEGAIEFY